METRFGGSIETLMDEICWDVMAPVERRDLRVDPIKYEITVHRIGAILREGSYSLVRTSGSPIVSEVGEYMFAIYDAEGHAAYVTAGVLPHLTGTEGAIKFIRAMFEGDIQSGDQFVINDPYVLGIHTPDVLIAKPVFCADELVCWVGSLTHCVEIGAKDPGGVSDSTDIFQEGIRLPGLKVMRRGERVDEVFRLLERGVRNGELMELDLRSKIAGNNVVDRRLQEIIGREGPGFVKDVLHKMIQETEERAKARIARIPDGIWQNRAFGDHNGRTWERIWCDVVAEKTGEGIHLDLSGSSPEQKGPVNTLLAGSIGSIFSVLVSTIFWDLIWNKGIVAPLKLTIPKGSMYNPNYPAPSYASAPTTAPLLAGTVTRIVAEMCRAAGLRESVCAPWNSSHCGVFMGGKTQFGQLEGTVTFDANAGGTGATLTADGDDTAAFILAPGAMLADVESYEAKYPLLYLFRRQRENSGGYGEHQGGLAHESAVMVHRSGTWRVGFRSIGHKVACTAGIFGGYPANSHVQGFVFRSAVGSGIEREALERLLRVEELVKLPQARIVPPMCPATPLAEGDVYFLAMSGGGGCGDPLFRSPEEVLADVLAGKISRGAAEAVYGVALEGEGVDAARTRDLRDAVRGARRARAAEAPCRGEGPGGGLCPKCGGDLPGLLPSAARRAREVMHFWVDDEWMVYRERYCPSCWTVLAVDPELV